MIRGKKIYCGITTTVKRSMYLEKLMYQLASYDIQVDLFVDDGSFGLIPNKQRCFRSTLQKAMDNNGVALILEDDIILCSRFLDRLNYIESQSNTSIISLFTRQRHLKKHRNKMFVSGVFKRGFYEQAILRVNNFGMYEKVWKYLEFNMQYTMPKERQKHHDVILQDYMVEHNIPWTVSVPTLVEHVGIVSTMKHQVGKSILYMDDVIVKDESQEKSQEL